MKIDKNWQLFAVIAVIFLVLKINATDYSISDENTYYKMGQLIAEGQTPYKDFFFAHTPLQVYMYAAAFKIFGFNLLLLKMLSAVAMVVTAAFVFAIAKENVNPKAAAGAAILFLFSYGTLLFSNFPTGAELAVPLVMAGFYFFQGRRFLLAGVVMGLAAITYQLSALALAILVAAAILVIRDKKAAAKLLIGFALVVGITALIFIIAAKGEFLKQTVLYHLQKPAESVNKSAIFLRILKTNALIFIVAAIALLTGNRARTTVAIAAATAVAYIALFPLLKTAFNYYLIFALPFLALMAAYGMESIYNAMVQRVKLTRQAAAVILSAIVLLSGLVAARQFSSYDSQDFPNAEEISAYVKENSLPNQTIFGDDSTVPLISILSGREIALNHADSNVMRYKAGQPNLEELLKGLDGEIKSRELKFIILRRIEASRGTYDFGIGTERQFIDFLAEKCKLAAQAGQHKVYDCMKT